ncbi:hypothetical protein [Streptomyces sp. NBC_01217]|uniref:hypothetical protein n=1 Tax=Streptomyces sp. NBC_01217 TaxID=2903779 RepID=UPI002E1414EE|nr:hypothetical protein OG507_24935 [Streptomyces sp. NBC_01217]
MTTAAVHAATDPRLRRGPVARRALQVILFLGGLLALVLLFGTRAYASEQAAATLSGTGTTVIRTAVEPDARLAADSAADAQSGPADVLGTEPAGEAAIASAVHATAEATARPLAQQAEPVQHVQEADADARMLLRTVATGVVDAVPVGPARLTLPDTRTPAPTDPPTVPRTVHGPAEDSARTPVAPHSIHAYTPAATAGPGGFAALRDAAVRGAQRAAVPEYRPVSERAPYDPARGPGRSASAEAHAPGNGDQHAVPFTGGSFFGLIRGAGLPATAAPVRDRSGDILEFPG